MTVRTRVTPAARSVVSQALAQGTNAATALARIPILVIALSASGYGTYTLVQALVPWLLVLPSGLRLSLRSMGAQALHSPSTDVTAVYAAHLTAARRLSFVILAGGLLASLGLSVLWPEVASPDGARSEAALVLVLTLCLCVSGFGGTVQSGWLEARGRHGLVNALGASTGLAGLVLTVALWKLQAPFAVFAVAGAASAVAPAWCVSALTQQRSLRQAPVPPALARATSATSAHFLIGAVSTLLAAGLAPFIVGAMLGPEAVASYFIAARLAVMVTLVPTALTPVLWNDHARLRSGSNPSRAPQRLRLVLLASGLLGLALGALFAVLGPRLAQIIGASEVDAPLSLYVAFGCHGALQFLQAPLSAALSGPRGSAMMARSTAWASMASVALSLPAVAVLGVSGPVWAIVVSFGVLMVVWVRKVASEGGFLTDAHDHRAWGQR